MPVGRSLSRFPSLSSPLDTGDVGGIDLWNNFSTAVHVQQVGRWISNNRLTRVLARVAATEALAMPPSSAPYVVLEGFVMQSFE
jgi:hypothetical protein